MVRAFRGFMDFCYITRRNVIDGKSLEQLQDALNRFHECREVFREEGVRVDFCLPRQHVMMHYASLIRAFGAPNGLCSSITESKHIRAVKKPWRRSNRHLALHQMLLTNQRLDKLAASRADFTARGMLNGTCLGHALGQIMSRCFDFFFTFGTNSIESGTGRDENDSVASRGEEHNTGGANSASNTNDTNNTDNTSFADSDTNDMESDQDGENEAISINCIDDNDDSGPIAGPTVLAEVRLAKTIGEHWYAGN